MPADGALACRPQHLQDDEGVYPAPAGNLKCHGRLLAEDLDGEARAARIRMGPANRSGIAGRTGPALDRSDKTDPLDLREGETALLQPGAGGFRDCRFDRYHLPGATHRPRAGDCGIQRVRFQQSP